VTFSRVRLLDGPCANQRVSYAQPLPVILVVADKTDGVRWHDYRQQRVLTDYRHASSCRCHHEVRPVELDEAYV